jgi:hypothetical protein
MDFSIQNPHFSWKFRLNFGKNAEGRNPSFKDKKSVFTSKKNDREVYDKNAPLFFSFLEENNATCLAVRVS